MKNEKMDRLLDTTWSDLPVEYRRAILDQADGSLFWSGLWSRVSGLKTPATFITVIIAAWYALGDVLAALAGTIKAILENWVLK